MLDPGRRDRLVTIEQYALTQDTTGGEVKTYSVFRKAWAQVVPLTARDRNMSGGVHSERESKFLIPYISGIDETMRISYDDLYWEILGIAEIGRREGLELLARAVK